MVVNGDEQGRTSCNQFNIEVSENSDGFNLDQVFAHCGKAMEIDYQMPKILVQGKNLIWQKQNVGTIVDNKISLNIITKDENDETKTYSLKATMSIVSGKLVYHYEWTDGTTLLIVDSKLKNSNSIVNPVLEDTQPTEVFCQFWNSITHDAMPNTIFSKFNGDELSVKRCSSQAYNNTGKANLGVCAEFTRASTTATTPNSFSVVLTKTNDDGITTILNKYERHLPEQKIENINLTADVGDGNFSSALCSIVEH
jgi:hypothetical protein